MSTYVCMYIYLCEKFRIYTLRYLGNLLLTAYVRAEPENVSTLLVAAVAHFSLLCK